MLFKCHKDEDFNDLIDLTSNVLMKKTTTIKGIFKQDPQSIEKMILSKFWPKAVNDATIVRTDSDIARRAEFIITSYVGNLANKKFLDVGCGTGACVVEAATTAKLARGFDIIIDPAWNTGTHADSGLFSTDFDAIAADGPYDSILMYDVFDHISEDKINPLLQQVRSVCAPNTIIRVRCHPWTSKHGGHLYEKLNKAYAHLFFTDEQIKKYQSSEVRKIQRPMFTYNKAWEDNGFVVQNLEQYCLNGNEFDGFFSQPDVVAFLEHHSPQKLSAGDKWQSTVLSIEFFDYILKAK